MTSSLVHNNSVGSIPRFLERYSVTDRPTLSHSNVRNAVKDGLARQGITSLQPTKRATIVFIVGAAIIYFMIRQMN